MDREKIRDLTRIMLGYGITETVPFTDAVVDNTINSVMPEIASKFGELETYRDFALVTDQSVYPFPRDYFMYGHAVFHDETTIGNLPADRSIPLTWVSRAEFEQMTQYGGDQTGEPQIILLEHGSVLNTDATQIPGDFCIWPKPSTNENTKYIRFHYFQYPDDIATGSGTDSRIYELPEYAHTAIALKAAEYLALQDKDSRLSQVLEQKYNRRMFDIMGIMRDNRPISITDSMNYGRGRRTNGRKLNDY